MSNITRALNIARRVRRQSGGSTTDQQSQQDSSSYLPAMTAPMGANVADYAKQSGYNAASGLQQADWSGNLPQNQAGAINPGQGGGQQPAQNLPAPANIQSGPAPAAAPQPTPAPETVSTGQGAPAQKGPEVSPALMRALQLAGAAKTEQQPATPTAGEKAVISASGKNAIETPGRVDAQGNETEAPSGRRHQDAIKMTADVAGLTDVMRQRKIQNIAQTDPLGSLLRGIFSGQQQPSADQAINVARQQAQPGQVRTTPTTPADFARQVQWPGKQTPGFQNGQFVPGNQVASDQFSPERLAPEGNGLTPNQPPGTPKVTTQPISSRQLPPQTGGDQTAPEVNGRQPNTIAPQAAPQPYRAPTMRELASAHNEDTKNIPDADQSPYKWWTSQHYFGILGGTMTGAEAVAKGQQYGKLTKEDADGIYAAAQKDYQAQKNPQATAQAITPQQTEQQGEKFTLTPGQNRQVGWDEIRHGIAKIESDGNYKSYGPSTKLGHALGKYQIMEAELPHQLRDAGLPPMTSQQFLNDPKAQETVFKDAFGRLISKYGNVDDAASAWLTGHPLATAGNRADAYGTTGSKYVNNLHAAIGSGDTRYGILDENGISAASPGSAPRGNAVAETPSGTRTAQAGIPGERPTIGSAGTGTPEQEAKAKNLRFQSWWREIWSGQANPMLPYERESAEMNLKNVWSDYDARRQFQYGTATPQEAARAAVGNEGSELSTHKALDGAVKGIQSERGEIHPGGTTALAGGVGASSASQHGNPQQAQQAWNEMSDEARNVAQAWGYQRQMLQDAQRYRASGSPQNVQIANGLTSKALEMQQNLIHQAAETGKVNVERLRQGFLQTPLGYFDLNRLDPQTKQPAFISNASLAKGIAEQLDRDNQAKTSPTNTPQQGGSSPSIGGSGVPNIGGQLTSQPQPINSGTIVPPPQQSGTQSKPIPASEEEKHIQQSETRNPKAPYAGPDYLNSRDRAVSPPAPSEMFKPGGPYSNFGSYGQDTSNKEGDNKLAESTLTRANAASRTNLQLEQILSEASKLKPGEYGPYAHERQEWIGKWNQMAKGIEASTGIPIKTFDTNASVDVIKLQSLEMAREIATGQGSSGRGAGVIMRMLIPHLPTADLPEAPDAIARTSAALKAEVARTQDYAREQNLWIRQGMPLGGFDDWFERAHPVGNYVAGAEIYGARNENNGQITNEMVDAARQNPAAAKSLQRVFKLSKDAMDRILSER